jgi:hypothetical protein
MYPLWIVCQAQTDIHRRNAQHGILGSANFSHPAQRPLKSRLHNDLASFETRLSALLRMRQIVDGTKRFTSS